MFNETEDPTALQYNFIARQITKYAGIFLYILCLCGTVMNILTFKRQTYNSRPCSLYLLVASIFDLIHLNLGPLLNIVHVGFHLDWSIPYIAFCKTKSYLTFVFGVMSATLTTLAAIDRYILSSRKISLWKYCTRHVAIGTSQFIVLFWFIFSLPILYCYSQFNHLAHNERVNCSNPSSSLVCLLVQIFYICIFNGFMHPMITMVFGFFTCTNIRLLRRRSLLKSIPIQKINYQLTSMVVLQMIKSSFSSLPFSIFNCYLLITRNMHKSSLHQAKENLINQIFYLLFWSNYTSFFVYLYSSDVFRKQWMKAMKSIVQHFSGREQRRRSFLPETNRLTVS